MNTKIVYSYNQETFEYSGESTANESPLEPGVFHIPANTVDVSPHPIPENKWPILANNEWSYVDYYKNVELYNINTKEKKSNWKIGEIPDFSIFVYEKPLDNDLHQKYDTNLKQWTHDEISENTALDLSITNTINIYAQKLITSGFASNAVGEFHWYDSEIEDQLNLTGVVALKQDMQYKCSLMNKNAVVADSKAWIQHTAAQLEKVMIDGAQIKMSILAKTTILKEKIKVLAIEDKRNFNIETEWNLV